jgi:membrane protease YdiL (CAAX protease family)
MIMKNELRPFWCKIFSFDWKFGLFLILIICIPRFILVLQANIEGNYGSIALIMLTSALLPFVFLNKSGQKEIGITPTQKYGWLLGAFVAGVAFSILLHYLGQGLYGNSYDNWYSYIGKSYDFPAVISPSDKMVLFSITALTGMLFSPIGEELFFRGIVYSSLKKSTNDRIAAIIESSAFAITHMAHFGLVYLNGQWNFLIIPTLIWVSSMFGASLLFLYFKKRSESIWGAVICHAGFNLGMIFSIFYLM